MTAVQVDNVHKSFGATRVINGVDIDIQDGEFVVLVGPSGCGKSTLLRMIAGLEIIGQGVIRIGNRVVNDVPAKDRDIAMVFQSYALYPHMTVAQNMGFSMRLKKASDAEMAVQVGKAAEMLGLTKLLDRFPKELSGGQRQRVAMGRALVRDPQVFLFDEPLSNLDAKLRVQMRAEIRALHQRLQTTTIYVTHDQVEAMTMADKIVVMRDGNVEQIGPPLDLYDKPVNMFVAGFIGSPAMNFLDGTADGGSVRIASGFMLAAPPGVQLLPGKAVVYGIRPEHLRLDDAGIAATVVVVEPTGSETQLLLDIGSGSLTCTLRDRLRLRPGDCIRVGFNRALAHVFDASNGKRFTESH